MAIYFIVVFACYLLLLIILSIGWHRIMNYKAGLAPRNNFISVVIAMRNEKPNLQKLLQSLADQNYPSANFEIIIVDDHSSDDSAGEAEKWINRFPSLAILSLNENQHGKKAALSYGIHKAQGEIIATTDADCVVPSNWLQRINAGFQEDRINMCIGAVALMNERSFLSQLQSIEFASVIGTGLALGVIGRPTMCNGANLSFRKKIFEGVNGYLGNEHIASGDDEFLMRKIQDRYLHSIQILSPHEFVVVTRPQSSITDFLRQRLRWASKWRVNSSAFARWLAVFMFLIQASWLTLMAWLVVDRPVLLVSIVALKLLSDFIFLSQVSYSLRMRFNFVAFIFLQVLYPVYVLYVGFSSQIANHQWKGRGV